jgi:hypothetical protein
VLMGCYDSYDYGFIGKMNVQIIKTWLLNMKARLRLLFKILIS